MASHGLSETAPSSILDMCCRKSWPTKHIHKRIVLWSSNISVIEDTGSDLPYISQASGPDNPEKKQNRATEESKG